MTPDARAEDADAFGLEEVDPDLPAKIQKWNADCLSCHSEEGLRHPPRAGMDMDALAKTLMDKDRFEHGDHGKMACKECHTEAYVPYPHLPNARKQIKTCESCHQQPAKTIVPEFKTSAHFKEHTDRFGCMSCHEAHFMRKASKLGSPALAVKQDNAVCSQCHDDDKRYGELKAKNPRPDMAKAHDWLPELPLHLQHVRCVECHTPVSDAGLSHAILGKTKAEKQCETCHAPETELGRRLYKQRLRDNPEPWAGFDNAALLDEVYVVGANGNRWLDIGGSLLVGLTLLAIIVRWLTRRLKRRKSQ